MGWLLLTVFGHWKPRPRSPHRLRRRRRTGRHPLRSGSWGRLASSVATPSSCWLILTTQFAARNQNEPAVGPQVGRQAPVQPGDVLWRVVVLQVLIGGARVDAAHECAAIRYDVGQSQFAGHREHPADLTSRSHGVDRSVRRGDPRGEIHLATTSRMGDCFVASSNTVRRVGTG